MMLLKLHFNQWAYLSLRLKPIIIGFILIVTAPIVLQGCNPAKLVNSAIDKDNFEIIENVSYDTNPRHRLDIYLPNKIPLKKPIVIFIYGGGWDSGNKSDYLFVGDAFTELGYITLIPDYRLYAEVQFPSFVEDVAKAISWLDKKGSDTIKRSVSDIILVGHSAGAHTAALLATDQHYLTKYNVNLKIKALVGLAGPYDLPLDNKKVKKIFATVNRPENAKPTELIQTQTPQALLLHGLDDTTVIPDHTRRFAARLREHNIAVDERYYSDIDHVQLIALLAENLRFTGTVYGDIKAYLQTLDAQ